VGFNRRFDPDTRRLAERLRAGEIGEAQMVTIVNRDPRRPPLDFVKASGGLFMDFAVHDFDMVRFLTGEEVVEVYAAGGALIDPAIGAAGDVDTALITLRLTSGAFALVDNSRETHYGYDQRIEVYGTEGSLRMENRRPTAVVAETGRHLTYDRPYHSYVERYRESYVAQLEAFFRCVREGEAAAVSGTDAAAAVAVARAARSSWEQKAPVALGSGRSAR
jgi:myo-inositol 2-dehydrogenase/D-chiro-inositol 1-dehydrogenase